MKQLIVIAGLAVMALLPVSAGAQDRYVEPPPVMVSPDLSAPWVMQLQRAPVGARAERRMPRAHMREREVRAAPAPVRRYRAPVAAQPRRHVAPAPIERQVQRPRRAQVRTAGLAAGAPRAAEDGLAPQFLPQTVDYDGGYAPGTIVVDTNRRFLFYVQKGGRAMRYGVGVGKEGFEWSGTHKITSKKEWPDWRPPAEMIAREKKKGRTLPAHMEGGPRNPLGARALYIGSTLYRIHGTNAPWTIGKAVSSGCIRMRNQDVMDLYTRVGVGAKVVVL